MKNCLLGTVKLVRNTEKSKLSYNDWGIAFGGEGMWSFDNYFAKNIVIFRADSISLSDTDNRKKHLVLGEGPTDSTNVSTGRAKKI